jgi:hypothetical protein
MGLVGLGNGLSGDGNGGWRIGVADAGHAVIAIDGESPEDDASAASGQEAGQFERTVPVGARKELTLQECDHGKTPKVTPMVKCEYH